MDVITALAVLKDVLGRCHRKDMRPEVFAALDFLATHAAVKWPFDQFRKSLHSRDPEGRWQTLYASLLSHEARGNSETGTERPGSTIGIAGDRTAELRV